MVTLKGNIANLEGTSGDQKPNDVPVNTIFRELDTNCSYYFTGESWVEIPSSGGGGGGSTDSYNDLENKPQINSVTLSGNKSLANLGIQGELTFDNSPTEDSTNPVTSGGVYSALANKQDTLTIDSAPTESSTNPVESGGVYSALGDKQDTLVFEGTYNASTNKAATESTVSGAVSTAIGNLSKSDVGLDNVTNNAQVKAVSGSVTNGGIATFGADGATVADSGKTIETSLTDTNDKLPTSKAIRDNVAANATLASGYTVDTSETSITSSTKINDAIEQLDYRTATNKTNILLNWGGGKNLFNPTQQSTSGTGYTLTRNADNTFHLVSTGSNSQQFFTLGTFTPSTTGTYYLTSGKVGGNNNTAGIYVKVGEAYYWAGTEEGEGIVLTLTGGTSYTVTCKLSASQTLDYLFKPMIRSQGDSTYQPYTISQDSGLPNTAITPALIECVDNGAKNYASINAVTSVANYVDIPINIKAGTYVLLVGSLSSTSQNTNCRIGFYKRPDAITHSWIDVGSNKSVIIDVPSECDVLRIFAGNTTSTTSGYSVTFTNLMLCKESEWNVSQTYQPYAMSNVELTTFAPTVKDSGSTFTVGTDYTLCDACTLTIPIAGNGQSIRVANIMASLTFNNSAPRGIILSTSNSTTDYDSNLKLLAKIESTEYIRLSAQCEFFNYSNSPTNVYVWVKSSSSAINRVISSMQLLN